MQKLQKKVEFCPLLYLFEEKMDTEKVNLTLFADGVLSVGKESTLIQKEQCTPLVCGVHCVSYRTVFVG